jgi:hypothetical protein
VAFSQRLPPGLDDLVEEEAERRDEQPRPAADGAAVLNFRVELEPIGLEIHRGRRDGEKIAGYLNEVGLIRRRG